jgi:hypothetical protein
MGERLDSVAIKFRASNELSVLLQDAAGNRRLDKSEMIRQVLASWLGRPDTAQLTNSLNITSRKAMARVDIGLEKLRQGMRSGWSDLSSGIVDLLNCGYVRMADRYWRFANNLNLNSRYLEGAQPLDDMKLMIKERALYMEESVFPQWMSGEPRTVGLFVINRKLKRGAREELLRVRSPHDLPLLDDRIIAHHRVPVTPGFSSHYSEPSDQPRSASSQESIHSGLISPGFCPHPQEQPEHQLPDQ